MKPHPDQHFGCITYAQHGEDLMLLNLFQLIGPALGTYLDLGAHHPSVISNTKLLYDAGWRGVNVEANPHLIEAFKNERPGDLTLPVAVAPPGIKAATLHMYSDTSGRNTISEVEVRSLDGVLKVKKTIEVPAYTINDIVINHCNAVFPTFLNCDIEGVDYAVIESADFISMPPPYVICVETRRQHSMSMKALLDMKGFFQYCRMGENQIFVAKSLRHLVY